MHETIPTQNNVGSRERIARYISMHKGSSSCAIFFPAVNNQFGHNVDAEILLDRLNFPHPVKIAATGIEQKRRLQVAEEGGNLFAKLLGPG
jgi:hypothetical protein